MGAKATAFRLGAGAVHSPMEVWSWPRAVRFQDRVHVRRPRAQRVDLGRQPPRRLGGRIHGIRRISRASRRHRLVVLGADLAWSSGRRISTARVEDRCALRHLRSSRSRGTGAAHRGSRCRVRRLSGRGKDMTVIASRASAGSVVSAHERQVRPRRARARESLRHANPTHPGGLRSR